MISSSDQKQPRAERGRAGNRARGGAGAGTDPGATAVRQRRHVLGGRGGARCAAVAVVGVLKSGVFIFSRITSSTK